MKKTFLQLAFLLIPFVALAQADAPVLEDFVKKTNEMQSFILNNNVNIVRSNIDAKLTEIAAVNDKMQVLWRTKIPGYALTSGLFKGKIFVVAATEHSAMLQNNNLYDGFLLDPANGKILVQKLLYDGETDHLEIPKFFAAKDGSFLKLVVRQTDMVRRVHVGLPGPLALIAINSMDVNFKETKRVTVTDFDENFNPISKVTPTLNGGILFGISCNAKGSLFLSWAKGKGVIDVERFEPGKTERAAMISVPFDLRNNSEARHPESHIKVLASQVDPNLVYLAVTAENQEGDTELSIGKVNFAGNSQQVFSEKIDRTVIKNLEKTYVVVNKKVDKPDLGNRRNIDVQFMGEDSGNLVVCMTGNDSEINLTSMGSSYIKFKAPIVSVYDAYLKLKVRQLIPTEFDIPYTNNPSPSADYFLIGGRLYFVANRKSGLTFTALYGVIDLATGKYIKQEYLPKNDLKKNAFADDAVMWFGSCFIVPYAASSGMFQFGTDKKDYTLQYNRY